MSNAVPRWQERALALDEAAAFPAFELAQLHAWGAFVVPATGNAELCELLRLVGCGNLAVGRLFEGHLNALALVALYGSPAQLRQSMADAAGGHLFAVWNTEPQPGLRLGAAGLLQGRKIFCSAAGFATRALVTATTEAGESRMVLASLEAAERVGPAVWTMLGMRACKTGSMEFDGYAVAPASLIGDAGDYLREPAFSAGAWRTSAVTVGGLQALVGETRRQLIAQRRNAAPLQRARIGEALIAQETALLWMRKAAAIAEGGFAVSDDVAAYVNLARIAIERACLDAMRAVQRSVGLAGLLHGNPLERMMRDLTTYLRQPAPDETLDEAAARFFATELPDV